MQKKIYDRSKTFPLKVFSVASAFTFSHFASSVKSEAIFKKKNQKKYPNDSYCRLKNNLGLFELFNRAEHLIKLNISKNITL